MTWLREARPGTLAGLAGMPVIAGLYVAHALLVASGGSGLSAVWLALLALPGVVAAHLSRRQGTPEQAGAEGVRGGLLAGHFAVTLQLSVLAIAVARVDWQRYAAQVGESIAYGVRDSALPAAAVTAALLVPLTYVGCAGAAWLGAAVYSALVRRNAGQEQQEHSEGERREA
ncbi:MAG TPA: hypothetical protein VFR15_06560 [Chloroflexia bacterium]|nr:hypothetical protein [Chloroflexia bacterium]